MADWLEGEDDAPPSYMIEWYERNSFACFAALCAALIAALCLLVGA